MEKRIQTIQAPFVSIARHRIQIDGKGVTTLVGFHGCPLRCKYCINPFSFSPDAKKVFLAPDELYQKVKIDELYFLATGGGVTFGGGEPLLYPDFITEFRRICGDSWHICAETSLAVPWENIQKASQAIDMFYIDCKDTNPETYLKYTGKDNSLMLSNIKKLTEIISPEKIIIRIPLIADFNTEEHQEKSKKIFSDMGITQFDLFAYTTEHSGQEKQATD